MSPKWNEKLEINFLKQYKHYPCLWNPYNKDYYNCTEKNKALQKIIDDLGIPGFTVNNYLHQIKIIREKYKECYVVSQLLYLLQVSSSPLDDKKISLKQRWYFLPVTQILETIGINETLDKRAKTDHFHRLRYKKEQLRIMKGLKSQKHYKSSFAWYNIVADMLTKVIHDEEKATSGTTLTNEYRDNDLKSLSSDNIWLAQRKTSKSVKVFPCNVATCDKVSRRSRSAEKSVRPRSRRNEMKSKKKTKSQSKLRVKHASSLQVTGTDSVSRNLDTDVDSSYLPTRDTEPNVREDDKNYGFLRCPLCGWEDMKYKKTEIYAEKPLQERIHLTPCPAYINDFSRAKYTTCTNCVKALGDYKTSRDTSMQIACPCMVDKFVETLTEPLQECHCSPAESPKKGVEVQVQLNPELTSKFQGNTIEACTRLKIILTDSKGSSKDTEFSLQNVPPNTRSVQWNKSEYASKEAKCVCDNILPKSAGVNTINSTGQETNTICASKGSKRCILVQTSDQVGQNEKEHKHPETDLIRSMESKETEANIVDKESKGIQTLVCASKGNSACSLSFAKMKETGTSPSVHQVRNVCVSTENLKRDRADFVCCISESSLTCCNDRKDSKDVADKGMQACENPNSCPRKILQIIREDPSIANILQLFLTKVVSRKMEHETRSTKASNSQTNYECTATDNCRLDVQRMVSKLREHAIKTLESNRNFAKDEVEKLNGKISKSTMSHEIKGKHASTELERYDTNIGRSVMTREHNLEPLFVSKSIMKDGPSEMSKDKTEKVPEVKTLPVADKEISAYSASRNIGTNGSLSQFSIRDTGIQSDSKPMRDSGFSARHDKIGQTKASIGTQKRDPILIRVIKCSDSQSIGKSDKETLTMEAAMDFEKKYTHKHVETCERQTCLAYPSNRQTKDRKLEYVPQKEHKNQMDRSRIFESVIKNFVCDKDCKDKIQCEQQDWTDVTEVDPFRHYNRSKIPLCLRHKCSYTMNE